MMIDEFTRKCYAFCSNNALLCDILLDICYTREGTKQLAWDVAGADIVENLLRNNDYTIWYPVRDPDGRVLYNGDRFSFLSTKIGGKTDEYCDE